MGEFGCTVDFISSEGSKCISTTNKVNDSTTIMLNMIILMNKLTSSFAVVVVFLELILNLYLYLFQGGNYDGILFASGLLQTVIYRFQQNHKSL